MYAGLYYARNNASGRNKGFVCVCDCRAVSYTLNSMLECLTPNMEVVRSTETSVNIYQSTHNLNFRKQRKK